ncbi:MAG: hypothetical protein ACOC89_04020 [Candidatus Saliniplasma sp.]
MSKYNICRAIIGLLLVISWIFLFSGFILAPAYIWFILTIITLLYYITIVRISRRKHSSLKDVIEDLEDYIERKSKENIDGSEKKEKSSGKKSDPNI